MSDNTTEATTTEAAAPAKEITTAKHARFLAETARKRIAKLQAEIEKATAQVLAYDELAATLPETNPTSGSAKAKPVYAVGTVVTFRFGRTTGTSAARTLTGTIKARKDVDGKAEAYKVAVGEGFDEQLFTVQPGAIVADLAAEAPVNSTEGL